MALTWSVAAVKNYEHVTTSPQTRGKPQKEQKWHPVTNQLIWFSMSCGWNEITEKNWEKIAERIAIMQHITGPALAAQDGDIFITDEDVKMHIGLSTNATKMTEEKFTGHMMNLARENSKRIRSGYMNRSFSSSGQEEMSGSDVCEVLAKKYGEAVDGD